MADNAEILLRLIEENWSHMRHHEEQRTAITGIIIVIAAAIQGGLTQIGFNKNALPITGTLIILGLFGMLATAKLYERSQVHARRASNLLKRLDELVPDIKRDLIVEISYEEHKTRYKGLQKIIQITHLYSIWIMLHSMIALLGIVFSIIIIVK